MATTAITSQTTAANSSIITLVAGATIQVYADVDLVGEEVVTLERTYDAGSNFVAVKTVREGNFISSDKLLTKKVTSAMVAGPGDFRLAKTATVTATAVFFDS